jgi:hypothetical protein
VASPSPAALEQTSDSDDCKMFESKKRPVPIMDLLDLQKSIESSSEAVLAAPRKHEAPLKQVDKKFQLSLPWGDDAPLNAPSAASKAAPVVPEKVVFKVEPSAKALLKAALSKKAAPKAAPEIAEQAVPEIAEQAVPEIAEQTVPEIAEQAVPEIAEQAVPEISTGPAATEVARLEEILKVAEEKRDRINEEIKAECDLFAEFGLSASEHELSATCTND